MRNKFYLGILLIYLVACSKDAPKPVDFNNLPEFKISFNKKTYSSGEEILLKVEQSGDNYSTALLVINNGLSIQTKSLKAKAKTILKINSQKTEHAGRYRIHVIIGDSIVGHKSVIVEPLKPHKELDIFAGPRSINSYDDDESMVVAVSSDKYFNSTSEGTPITFDKKTPGQNGSLTSEETRNQLSYHIIPSSAKASSQHIGVSNKQVGAKEQRIDFIPGWPNQITIKNRDYHPYANNRHFTIIKTDKLFDINSNQISDGTLIQFKVLDKFDQLSIYNAMVIDGIATTYIKNPKQANEYLISAFAKNNVKSNVLKLQFQHDLKDINFNNSSKAFIVGPLTGQLGQFISDGTSVKLTVGGKTFTEESIKGYASFSKSGFPKTYEQINIEVAGLNKTLTLAKDVK